MLKETIASRLEMAFSQLGFAESSVSQLKVACDVSLRTLYRYFPSKEAMIVGALEYRHQRYLLLLKSQRPETELEASIDVFNKLVQWMQDYAPNGCLYTSALAAYPDNAQIQQLVTHHKQQVRHYFLSFIGREDWANTVYLLHEGVSNAWPVLGQSAADAAVTTLKLLMENNNNDSTTSFQ